MIQIDGEDIVFIDSLGRTLRLTREKVEALIERDMEDAAENKAFLRFEREVK